MQRSVRTELFSAIVCRSCAIGLLGFLAVVKRLPDLAGGVYCTDACH